MKNKEKVAPVFLRHFAINADDVARAKNFYQKIFDWKFQPWGPPEFFMVEAGPDSIAVHGSLQRRRALSPGLVLHGLECTFGVDDVRRVMAAVRASGGRILMEPAIIPGVGELIFFQDTEGNVVGAMRYDDTIE